MSLLSLPETLYQRRQRLTEKFYFPVILWSGGALSRNFPANRFPFRASSHFLYFSGFPLENAAIRLEAGKLELFVDDPEPGSALWHGEMPNREEIARSMGADAAYPLAELESRTGDAATIAVQDFRTWGEQAKLLQRPVLPAHQRDEGTLPDSCNRDRELAKAIVALRLTHDEGALSQLRLAADIAVAAHRVGMQTTPRVTTEAEVRGAIEAVFTARQATCAYNSIVTVQGEVLHNERSDRALQPGDLLLVDAGAETPLGWASDITRTYPVTGKFSPTQRDIYQLVLAAHDACIAKMQPGVEYREIHLLAASVLAEGLVELGILQGNPTDLVERDAHALFFPHGIGHSLGLDVHDLEDLGDLAGYAEGRKRSDRFGLSYLRLDRPLQAGMLVTIEPGFYQVPGILNDPKLRSQYRKDVNWERLEQFADTRGIRIEDDVLVTESGTEILTAALPNAIAQIEQIIRNS
ncbi:aminopeptidase P family protein [Oscillatoria sp. FACHB-1406]|uniref:aminopeptidase P family protein n=1 Tax=Oscillatoria sp. FACHB-1406 TaxID=2692846 RepID=UPI0016825705|nr:aminopeptidase P family protein [Oscillatoria sp. FACHB-1406]MBD2579933.1 aminopeptidase P family protein [Oscillatoria sp. FACHB-1406]